VTFFKRPDFPLPVEPSYLEMSNLALMVTLISLVICYHHISVATISLGAQPKQGLARVWAKGEARESHFMLLGVQENVRE
jgi:hypothetical protein